MLFYYFRGIVYQNFIKGFINNLRLSRAQVWITKCPKIVHISMEFQSTMEKFKSITYETW